MRIELVDGPLDRYKENLPFQQNGFLSGSVSGCLGHIAALKARSMSHLVVEEDEMNVEAYIKG